MDYIDVGSEIVDVGGYLIEKDALGIIERIQSYDPNLVLVFLDPNRAEICDAPYLVCERCPDGLLRRIMEVWKLDETVVERLYRADTWHNDIMSRLDRDNQRVRDEQKRRFREVRDEAKDQLASLLRSPKTSYTVPTTDADGERHTVTIHENYGVVKRDGKSV